MVGWRTKKDLVHGSTTVSGIPRYKDIMAELFGLVKHVEHADDVPRIMWRK
jgi:hypothetical protein